MASDITLVLRSEHKELLVLADQCERTSRGFQDPQAELDRALAAHLGAASAAAYTVPAAQPLLPTLDRMATEVSEVLSRSRRTRADLAHAARVLVEVERERLLPALDGGVPIGERRRMGKVFRIRRDTLLRGAPKPSRRTRSQSELYEVARRAGVEHRSRMTQAQLQAAVEAWERAQSRPTCRIGSTPV